MAKILIVDDHADTRSYLVKLLGYGDHQLLEAADGVEGLVRSREMHPDLVIADLLMPSMDGYEFVRQLRADPTITNTRVIFHSAAYHEREVRPLAATLGVTHILNKPARPEDVLRLVEDALGRGVLPVLRGSSDSHFDRRHLRIVSEKLTEKAAQLEATNLRLTSLIELGLQLSAERDPVRILEHGCQAARQIVGARCTAVAILAADGASCCSFITRGVDAALASSPSPQVSPLAQILRDGKVARRGAGAVSALAVGLPCERPTLASFLGTPIRSSTRLYGILYLADKLGAAEFTEEDERLAATVAAKVAIAYENARTQAELEQQVQERTVELKQSNQELEQFAYIAAHDLQEPLRKVVAYTQLLAEKYPDKLDAEAGEFVDYAVDGAVRMQALIKDLLDYSRVGRKGKEFRDASCDRVLDCALANLSAAVEKSGARVIREPLPVVKGDERQLIQLFQNLIGNAIKFRGDRSPVIHVRAQRVGAQWLFSVRDNGIGVDPQFAERIFEIFQRLHGRGEYPGTGIGLAICRKVVERHGGRIWVESHPELGSSFFFTIPA